MAVAPTSPLLGEPESTSAVVRASPPASPSYVVTQHNAHGDSSGASNNISRHNSASSWMERATTPASQPGVDSPAAATLDTIARNAMSASSSAADLAASAVRRLALCITDGQLTAALPSYPPSSLAQPASLRPPSSDRPRSQLYVGTSLLSAEDQEWHEQQQQDTEMVLDHGRFIEALEVRALGQVAGVMCTHRNGSTASELRACLGDDIDTAFDQYQIAAASNDAPLRFVVVQAGAEDLRRLIAANIDAAINPIADLNAIVESVFDLVQDVLSHPQIAALDEPPQVLVCAVPPLGSPQTARRVSHQDLSCIGENFHHWVNRLNSQIRARCVVRKDVTFVDLHRVLEDPKTSCLGPPCDAGDGFHLSPVGVNVAAWKVASVIYKLDRTLHQPDGRRSYADQHTANACTMRCCVM